MSIYYYPVEDASTALQEITSTDGSITISQAGTTVNLAVATDGSTTNVVCLVRNNTGATLTKGTAVYINGAIGQNPTVTKALAIGEATSSQTLGLMTANLANNSNGYVTITGLVTDLDTSAFTDGQQLYLSPTTAGTLTSTKQYAPNHLVYVAIVVHAHPTQGKLLVRVQDGYEMDELHDVSAQSPTTGQTLVYNAATDLWEKSNAPIITGGTINNAVIGGTTPVAGTFTTIDIVTSGTDAEIAPNTGITGWNYSGLSKSITTEETVPNGLFISSDGLNMYVNGATGDDVNQYTLSTAWDVSTATFVRLFSTAAQDSSPQDVFFKPDGLSMYIMGGTNDTVFQYTLSSAFNISTASYASKSFSVTSQENAPTGLWFKPDGTVMYVIGTTSDAVFQYNLGTAWDVSTASYASISFSFATQETSGQQINLSADGLTMWVFGANGDDINQYALGTAFNVSTAVFENSFYIGFQDTSPTGLFIDSTANNRVYLVGSASDTVYQYNTATNSISAVTDVFNTTSNARVQGNLAVQSNAYVDGTLTAQGAVTVQGAITANSTISASSTLTLNGTTSSTTTLGTAATTGTTTIGGTSQTGIITVGQSTVSQTTNIQAGATASGSTKTMNIGTAGVSGSTTAINIGSAVSGATSRTTLNGIVIDSISAAVSAAGATQATATALVSNVNNVTVVAAGADGVRLPTAVAGMRILVRNSDSADTLSIYPATGGTINALAANAAFTLAAGSTTELMATTATQWYTF